MEEYAKIYLWHNGDPSVGYYGESYTLDSPFPKYNHKNPGGNDFELSEYKAFLDKIHKVYNEASEYELFAAYDFELEQENEFQQELDEQLDKYEKT